MPVALRLFLGFLCWLAAFGGWPPLVRGEEEPDRAEFADVALSVGTRTMRLYPGEGSGPRRRPFRFG